jgi:hypothetical protein
LVLCFNKTQPFVKQKPVKTEKKIPERSCSILCRFYCNIDEGWKIQQQFADETSTVDNGQVALAGYICRHLTSLYLSDEVQASHKNSWPQQ